MGYLKDLAAREEQKRLQNIKRQEVRDDHIANGRQIPWSYQTAQDFTVPNTTSPWKQEYSDRLQAVVGSGPLTQWSMDSQNIQEQRDPNTGQIVPMGPAPILTRGAAPQTAPQTAPILESAPEVENTAPPPLDQGAPAPALDAATEVASGPAEDDENQPFQMSFAEKMGRYGGNIMNAEGGMAQVGAMGSTTAEIYEAERAQNQQIEENEVARLTKPGTASAALQKQAEIENMYDTQVKYDQAIQDFIKYGDSVTGLLDSTVQSAKDSQGIGNGDPEREAFRYRIKDIIISDTLLQTAKTSGAISDKEMALFKSGVPKMTDQESVWIAWLTKRSAYLKQINQRIANGVQVSATANIGFTGYTPASPSGQSGTAPSALTQAQTDAMTNNIK